MDKREVRNAIITDVTLGIDDHGVLSAWLMLDYGNSGQGFGGFALYLPKTYKNYSIWGVAGHFIYRCLKIADVEYWSQLKGKAIRVECDYRHVYKIGHILNDDWFCPEEEFDDLKFDKPGEGTDE